MIHYWPIIIGSSIGFLGFLAGVCTIDNVVYRKDSDGIKRFTLSGLEEYMKLPFNPDAKQTAWALFPELPLEERLKLLNLNWVFMVSCGAVLGSAYMILV